MDKRDLPGLLNVSEPLPDLGRVYVIAGRLMRLSTAKDGDRLGEALRTAAAELEAIADTLTHETRWPFLEGID